MTKVPKKVVAFLRGADECAINMQQTLAQIPCPDYRAGARAAVFIEALEAEGLAPKRDRVGNVVAIRRGAAPRKKMTLVLCAHLDSVFPEIDVIKVRRKGNVLYAPGICDDVSGVANLVVLAKALKRFAVKLPFDIVFVGSVGEEGGGKLWGIKHFWKTRKFVNPLFVAIDGADPGRIVKRALGTWNPAIEIKGPGGHGFNDFGRPNPIQMAARIVTKLSAIKVDKSGDATYSATVISGGNAINAIPQEVVLKMNIRSSNADELKSMQRQVTKFIREARTEELAWATKEGTLSFKVTAKGRPAGETPADHRLVVETVKAHEAEGLKVEFTVASTDSNMPMSLGIPAVTICAGGTGHNMHGVDESHDMNGRTKELAALGRIVFAFA